MYDYSECKFVFVFFSGKMVKNHYEKERERKWDSQFYSVCILQRYMIFKYSTNLQNPKKK